MDIRERESLLDRTWLTNWFWLAPMAVAVGLTAVILMAVGSDRAVESLGVFILKLLPYCFAAIAIATFPRSAPNVLKVAMAFATIVPFFVFFVPRQFNLMREGVQAGYATAPRTGVSDAFVAAPGLESAFDDFYIVTQVMVPFVLLMVVAAFRFGGGSFASTMKLATAAILFMISGIEDIMYFAINGPWPMPDKLPWISHMTVRLGHVVSRNELFVVCGLHFVAIAIVLVLPVDRWVERVHERRLSPQGRPSTATP